MVGGLLLILISGSALVGAKLLISRYAGAVHQQNLLADGVRGSGGGDLRPGQPLNLLLVGVDARPGQDPTDLVRSDSIIILHIAPSRDYAYLASIPRDLVVDIPADPATGHGAQTEKINAAFAFGADGGGGWAGGFQLLSQTVSNVTGLRFDGGAIVNFGGFKKVAEALGGVDMCIDEEVTSIHIGFDRNGKYLAPDRGGEPVVYKPGCQHLKPWQALDFVRQRHLDGGDYARQQHQQQFLKAMLSGATSKGVLSDPIKLDKVLRAAGDALTVDSGGVPITDWLWALRNLRSNGLMMLKTDGSALYERRTVTPVKSTDPAAPAPKPTVISEYQGEQLNDGAVAMFAAMRDGTLDEFVTSHPDELN